jgi:glycosyltransferase involved in cell wall biosynthesis
MRVLLIHNHYRSSMPSGENVSFRSIATVLAQSGHEVDTFERHSDDIAKGRPRALIEAGLFASWNPFNGGALASAVRRFAPDIAHVENTFPLLSPSVYWTLSRLGVPVVASMRNYRSWCAAGIAYRDEAPCRLCLDRASVLPALRHGCYKNSRIATVPVAGTIALHRQLRTLSRQVRLVIANSEFLRRSMIDYGVPGERVVVNPNFVNEPARQIPWAQRDNRVVFVGRLGAEKGAADLVHAWSLLPHDAPVLDIVGDGPALGELQTLTRSLGQTGRIRFLGRVTPAEVAERLATSRLLVFPSRWYETFGRGVIEAYAHGVPALVAEIGALPELVVDGHTGRSFAAGDVAQLAARVRELFADPAQLERMGLAARARYLEHYTSTAALKRLEAIYARALQAPAATGARYA